MLQLKKPLISLDVETTGTNPKEDRIVQIGLVKLYPDGHETEWETLVNPGIPVPEEVTKIHGITNEMLATAPTFKSLAPMLAQGFSQGDFCGFNLRFDLDFLTAEFARAGVANTLGTVKIVDAHKIFQMKEPRTLSAAVKKYLGVEHEGAHNALVDARMTLRVMMKQLEIHPDLPQTVDELHKLLFETAPHGFLDPDRKIAWRNGRAVIAFGNQFNGVPLEKVNHDFLRWVLRKDFNPAVKKIIVDALRGVFPESGK